MNNLHDESIATQPEDLRPILNQPIDYDLIAEITRWRAAYAKSNTPNHKEDTNHEVTPGNIGRTRR